MAKCKTCAQSVSDSATGLVQIKTLNKMMSSNYMVFFLSLFFGAAAVMLIFHFSKKVIAIIKDHRDLKEEMTIVKKDDQDYTYDNENEDLTVDRTKYMKKGKRDFIKKINNIYDEYNLLKTDFIKNEFKEKNDDIIDKNILYKNDDNYKYKKKSEYY